MRTGDCWSEREARVHFRGIKQSTANEPEQLCQGAFIEDVLTVEEVMAHGVDVIAGAMYLFARLDRKLDYLLEGAATSPPDRGIFLDITWRLHPTSAASSPPP